MEKARSDPDTYFGYYGRVTAYINSHKIKYNSVSGRTYYKPYYGLR